MIRERTPADAPAVEGSLSRHDSLAHANRTLAAGAVVPVGRTSPGPRDVTG